MDYFLLFGILAFAGLIISFLAYKFTTDKIIKDQEREIAALHTENKRLKSALRGSRYVTKIVLSDKPIDYPATAKITKTQERDY